MKSLDVIVIGGGMYTLDVILPSLYHLQRLGHINRLQLCARHSRTLRRLAADKTLKQAFPGQSFEPHPALNAPDETTYAELYKEVLAAAAPYNLVIVAVPDQLHYEVVMEAIEARQHILCVKPLVLNFAQGQEISVRARELGLLAAVEYHKRFDRRALIARRDYQAGRFGDFAYGEARLMEPYCYRNSNFQQWFTCEETDPFVYVGCHYVDLVCFITGLQPVSVSVQGVTGDFPNGKTGYMWTTGRVQFENGSLLTVSNGLGYPDQGAGSNHQGLHMYCEADGQTGLIEHDDQYRGVRHTYVDGKDKDSYRYINPDFFKLVPWQGDGLSPIGYGYDSVAAGLHAAQQVEQACYGQDTQHALTTRQKTLQDIDRRGLLATASNSDYNDLVVEGARLSIVNNGMIVDMDPAREPYVVFRTARNA